MTLTKAQKELLETMKDKGYYIYHWIHGTKYSLLDNDHNQIKAIRYDWIKDLSEFFTKSYVKAYQSDEYRIKPDAQISDAWHQAERQRLSQIIIDAEVAKQAEKERLNKIASDYFNEGNSGPYQVSFDGQWPFGGGIFLNGKHIAQIGAFSYSTSDKTFNDILKRPGNVEHFEAIRTMLRAANNMA